MRGPASFTRWRRRFGRSVAVATILAGLAQCADAPPDSRINVLLISIDTLRADHLTRYGYGRPTSPTADALARRGVRFEDCSAPSPWTPPSHASLMTGLYPGRCGLPVAALMPDDVTTLAEALDGRGYQTAAVVNSIYVSRNGFERGLQHFEYVQELLGEREPSDVTDKAIDWLTSAGRKPFFLFAHYYDVHSDYRSLPQYERQFTAADYDGVVDGTTGQLIKVQRGEMSLDRRDREQLLGLYDASVRQTDEQIARLIDTLRKRGLLERTLIVFTADHGETRDVVSEHPEIVERLLEQLRVFEDRAREVTPAPPMVPPEIQRLKDLGYLR